MDNDSGQEATESQNTETESENVENNPASKGHKLLKKLKVVD